MGRQLGVPVELVRLEDMLQPEGQVGQAVPLFRDPMFCTHVQESACRATLLPFKA